MKEIVFLAVNKIISIFQGSMFARIPGAKSVIDLIYEKSNPEKLILINVQGLKMYVDTKDTIIGPSLMISGYFDECETELFKKLIKTDTILIDIGANIGYFSLIGASLINTGKIYSFEPEPHNFRILSKNIEINGFDNINPVNKALSNEMGKHLIFTDSQNFGNHSLAENNVPDINNSVEVETVTLDSFFNKTEWKNSNILIKMDTQGAEGFIIDGSKSFLKNNDINNIKIIMEFWPVGLKNMGTDPLNLLEKLRLFGFEIWAINETEHSLNKMTDKEIMAFCECHGELDHINLLLKK